MSEFDFALATSNRHKVEELAAIFADHWPDLDPQRVATNADFPGPDPVEDAPTFAGNALIKARSLAQRSGLITVADDSGLCVDIMGGAPGIFSARWCGHHGDSAANLQLLLAQLNDVPATYRGARFACAAALVVPGKLAGGVAAPGETRAGGIAVGGGGTAPGETRPDNPAATTESTVPGCEQEIVCEGELVGSLLTAPVGDGGFGYDPIFVPTGYEVTTAQMSAAQKNAISHRARAFTALLPHLRAALQTGWQA